MAESVQRNMEFMTPDIIELYSSQLFKGRELTLVVNKRQDYEFKLNGTTKRPEDFKEAIQYEQTFLAQIRKRRVEKELSLKKQKVDYHVLKRIQSLFTRALNYFNQNYELHLEYFYFLAQYKVYENHAIQQIMYMVQQYFHNYQIFRVAAAFYHKIGNVREAKNILHRGLVNHPRKHELYLDLINIELKEPHNKKLEDRIKVYIENSFEQVKSADVLIECLGLLEPHSDLRELETFLIEKMLEKYSDDVRVWGIIALTELKGNYHKASKEEEAQRSPELSIERCVKVYKEGFSKLPPEKHSDLWGFYISAMIDIQKKGFKAPTTVKTTALRTALEDAKKAKYRLTDQHWMAWVDASCEDDELLAEKLDQGLQQETNSPVFWSICLKHHLLKDNKEEAIKLFERGLKILGAKALPLWEIYIEINCVDGTVRDLEALYKRGVTEPYEEIVKVLRPKYICWLINTKGIEEVRAAYNELEDRPPLVREMYDEMYQTEMMVLIKNEISHALRVAEKRTKLFGSKDVSVWLDWAYVYRKSTDLDQNEKIKAVYEKAVATLEKDLVDSFKEKFNAFDSENKTDDK